MFRISSIMGIFLIMAMGVVVAQNGKTIVGAHIEWEGTEEPEIRVDPASFTLEINLQRDRECVTVYSPPANKDYTIVVKTKNGTVTAAKPHPQGFQARFCFNQVGQDQILRVHIWLGRATFQGVDDARRELQAEQVVNFILPATGEIRYEEGAEPLPGETRTERGEYYDRTVGRVSIRSTTPRWEEARKPDGPTDVHGETPTEPERVTPPPERPGISYVTPKPVDVPTMSSQELERMLAEGRTEAVDTNNPEYQKYYVVQEEDPPAPVTPWYQDFKLDHSSDIKIRMDTWFGFQRTRQEGTFRVDGDIRGNELNILDDLELDDRDADLAAGFDIYVMGAHLGFDVSQAEFEGDTTFLQATRIGDILFPVGSIVKSDFEHSWYRFTLGYTAYMSRNFGVGFDFYGEFWRFDYRVQDTVGQKASGDALVFIPSLGLHVDYSPQDRWLFTIGSHGIWFDYEDVELWMVNIEGWIRFFPCQCVYLFIRGEWEADDYQLKDASDLDLNVDLSAWNVSGGIGIRF